ncbi:MAG: DUF3696 domain-containing protein [Marinifilum sp.]|jgi:predicted ATPase|nr:DUF3696 domain-containing protein [Marinifilum sp.]
MIKEIQLSNFKTHKDTTVKMSNLNILAGMNGYGKSSLIQSLLLLRQSNSKGLLPRGLDLNGDLCSIGLVRDCLSFDAESEEISIVVTEKDLMKNYRFLAELNDLSDTFIKSKHYNPSEEDEYDDDNIESILFNENFQYISAFRNGPTDNYPKDTSTVEIQNQISRIEGRCELVAHYLDYFRNNEVIQEILYKDSTDNQLLKQVELWMHEISPNIKLHIKSEESSFKLNYSYSETSGYKTQEFKSTNIGFGISYALPIVVSILKACSINKIQNNKSDSKKKLIIIENPEAHIHPSGQAKLVELICKAAKLGIQFIIETQSDHVINGLLVAIKKETITENECSLYFFDREKGSHAIKAHQLEVTNTGRIKKAPKGFFDQFDKDMQTLMGF